MGAIDNLNKGDLADLIRRVRTLENRTTLNNAAIGRAGMEVYDGGSINISNGTFYLNGYGSVTGTLAVSGTLPVTGGLIVSGTERITGSWFLDGVGEVAGTMTVKGGLIVEGEQRVSGTLEITGDLTVTGPTKLDGKTDIGGNTTVTGDLGVKGPLDVTGATKLDGKTDIGGNTTVTGKLDVTGAMATKGTFSVEGKTTLKNDLSVTEGGKIKAGNLEIEPANGGQINFLNGGITSDDFGMGIVNTIGIQLIANKFHSPGLLPSLGPRQMSTSTARAASGEFPKEAPGKAHPGRPR